MAAIIEKISSKDIVLDLETGSREASPELKESVGRVVSFINRYYAEKSQVYTLEDEIEKGQEVDKIRKDLDLLQNSGLEKVQQAAIIIIRNLTPTSEPKPVTPTKPEPLQEALARTPGKMPVQPERGRADISLLSLVDKEYLEHQYSPESQAELARRNEGESNYKKAKLECDRARAELENKRKPTQQKRRELTATDTKNQPLAQQLEYEKNKIKFKFDEFEITSLELDFQEKELNLREAELNKETNQQLIAFQKEELNCQRGELERKREALELGIKTFAAIRNKLEEDERNLQHRGTASDQTIQGPVLTTPLLSTGIPGDDDGFENIESDEFYARKLEEELNPDTTQDEAIARQLGAPTLAEQPGLFVDAVTKFLNQPIF